MCSTTLFVTLVKGPLATVVDETHVRDYDYTLRAARSTPSCSSARSQPKYLFVPQRRINLMLRSPLRGFFFSPLLAIGSGSPHLTRLRLLR